MRRVMATGRILLIGLALMAVLVPLAWLFVTSIKMPDELFQDPPVLIPSAVTFEHYRDLLTSPNFLQPALNSLIVATAATLASTLLGAMAAYSLARMRLPLRLNGILAGWFLITRMYPAISTAIPYFLLMKTFGLLDTRWALIITYTGFNLSFVVWQMLGYYQELPIDLENAAFVDGASTLQTFLRVTMPLTLPGLASTAVFAFIMSWNEFLFAVILTSVGTKTLPVSIAGFITDKNLAWAEMSAFSILTILPVVIFALATQRYLVRGLTMGAVKG
ncbi:carbohydrate ABC transporter permease [Limnochorda pilosa]|uniref:ABC transporter permease n=1 Tax=Limnochorda pilosa TaxID=1555112 RepID=A0A0K2SM37_LIMPI|nr:carbohydrate ABC transporter permease [Limnochorda pilosa]BAS28171.1 ABC transporter permease [Limnochorda pilosa]